MSCKLDVRNAILNDVFTEFVNKGPNTFTRLSEDTVRVNNRVDNRRTKATNNNQAYKIANNLLDRVKKEYKGKVSGYLHAASAYEAQHVTFTVNPAYVEHEYAKLPQAQQTDIEGAIPTDQQIVYPQGTQGDLFADALLAPLSTAQGIPISPYKELMNHKKRLIDILIEKERSINATLKGDITPARRRELLRDKNRISERLEGDKTKNNPGLFSEVRELAANANTNAVGFYMEQDLKRLKTLVASDNPADIAEAKAIVQFFEEAGTFEVGVENPFFLPQEIFTLDANGKPTGTVGLDPATVAEFERWAKEATFYKNQIADREKRILEQTFNEDYDTLIGGGAGIKDVDKLSLWVMDITQGLGNPATKYLQLMHKEASERIERKLNKGRDYIEKLSAMQDAVTKELSTLNNGQYRLNTLGILGIKGVSFDLFMQKFRSGRDTGKLISMFSEEYNQLIDLAKATFFNKITQANNEQDPVKQQQDYNDAHTALLREKRKNTMVMELGKIPEIANDPEFALFQKNFTDDGGAHKKVLIDLLGQREYDRQVAEQKKLLIQYMAQREDIITSMVTQNGVPDFASLSPAEKFKFQVKDASMNPFMGVRVFYGAGQLQVGAKDVNNDGKYNLYIPRKYVPSYKIVGNDLVATDTTQETGHYNKTFDIIKGNKVLSDFHELALETLENIHENLPPEVLKYMSKGTLPAHKKAVMETLLEEKGLFRKIFPAIALWWDKFRSSWAMLEEGLVSDTITDRRTGKKNYQVNSQFVQGNIGAIARNTELERISFLQVFNGTVKDPNDKVGKIGRNTSINIKKFSPEALLKLSEYLNAGLTMNDIQRGDLTKITNTQGQNISIGRAINEFVTHSVVQGNSYDLFKLLKLYTSLSSEYAARKEMLPFMEIAKSHHDEIDAPELNNTGDQKIDKVDRRKKKVGKRTRAIAQNEDWFQRGVLNNHEREAAVKLFFPKVTTREEKKEIRRINDLISKETDKGKIAKLEAMKKGIGRVITSASIVDRLLAHVRFLGLAISPLTAVKNGIDGFVSNMKQASSNEFYDGKHMYYAYKVTRWSRLKAATLGKYDRGVAKKNSTLMRRYSIIMDSRNDLQKSSVKTNFSALSNFDPYYLNTAQEFVNQSPIMICMLKTAQIKGINPNETSSVWDAMDDNGNLAAPFRTPENIATWETMESKEYYEFKAKVNEAIVRAHGNYDNLRGMKLKSETWGKVLMSMKTWMTSQLFERFAEEQYNEKTQKKVKGRYRSFTAVGGMSYGFIMGSVASFPVGTLLGVAIGAAAAFSRYGVKSEVHSMTQLLDVTKELAKRMVGVPINLIAGKSVINTTGGFDNWVKGTKFTEVDARNMRANIMHMNHILSIFLLYLLIRSMFSDDDDDDEVSARNFMLNIIVQTINNSFAFMSLDTFWKDMVATPSLFRFLDNSYKTTQAMQSYMEGEDINDTGDNRGKSKLWGMSKKVLLPSLLRDPMGFGTSTLTKRVYNDLRWSKNFQSAGQQEKRAISRNRAELKVELEEAGEYSDEQIKKIVNERYPTQAKLKKMGMTVDEYEDQYGSSYEMPEVEVQSEEEQEMLDEKRRQKGLSTEEAKAEQE